jgi:hypothetical protein
VIADDEMWVINNGGYCKNDHPEAGETIIAAGVNPWIEIERIFSAGKDGLQMKTFGAGGGRIMGN